MAEHAAELFRPGRACSPTATPARSRPAATAPRSASARRGGAGLKSGSRRRDPPAAAGRAPHRVGARARRHPARGDRRLGGRLADGERQGRPRRRGRRPDRRNGDIANKIGTYALAVLAAHHEVPFYVVAPTSTLDPRRPTAPRSRSRSATAAEVTRRFAAQSRLRRHAGRADRGDRHRARGPSAPYEERSGEKRSSSRPATRPGSGR